MVQALSVDPRSRIVKVVKAWTGQFVARRSQAGRCHHQEQPVRPQGPHLLYLAPYSPGLNPIEQVFAKFKVLLRRAAARTIGKLWLENGQ